LTAVFLILFLSKIFGEIGRDDRETRRFMAELERIKRRAAR
jgi:hypothetical protein